MRKYSDLEMPWKLYRKALQILIQRLQDGEELSYYDDTTIGNKSLHNSWGLCSQQKEQWPDPEMHLWPDQFTERGRVAPRYRQEGQWCPNDRRAWEYPTNDPTKRSGYWKSGCFYTCMFFQPDGRSLPNHQQVIALAQTLLNRSETQED